MYIISETAKISATVKKDMMIRNTNMFLSDYKQHPYRLNVGIQYNDNFVFINEIKRK